MGGICSFGWMISSTDTDLVDHNADDGEGAHTDMRHVAQHHIHQHRPHPCVYPRHWLHPRQDCVSHSLNNTQQLVTTRMTIVSSSKELK